MSRRAGPVLVGVAFGLFVASSANAEDSYSLKRAFKSGEVDKYRTVITMETDTPANPMTLEFTILTTETVKDVKPDGSAVVELKVDAANMVVKDKVNTATREMNDSTVITSTFDASGKETKRDVSGENGQPGPAAMLLGLVRTGMVPPKALRSGEDWKYDIPAADAKAPHRTGVVTVVGLEKRPGATPDSVLRVRYSTDVSTPRPQKQDVVVDRGPDPNRYSVEVSPPRPQGPPDKVSIVSTALLDPGTGKALELDGTGSGKLGQLIAKKIVIKQQRIAAAAK
jgi:hypothetical protein